MNEDELENAFYDLLDEHDCMVQEIVWTTKDGQKMPLGEMSPRHLKSSIIYFGNKKFLTMDNITILIEQIEMFPDRKDEYQDHLEQETRKRDQWEFTIYVLEQECDRRNTKERGLTISPQMIKLRSKLAELPKVRTTC